MTESVTAREEDLVARAAKVGYTMTPRQSWMGGWLLVDTATGNALPPPALHHALPLDLIERHIEDREAASG